MRKWIEENKVWLIAVGIIILVGVPSVVYLLVMIPLFSAGANNDWTRFWGGYAGMASEEISFLAGAPDISKRAAESPL